MRNNEVPLNLGMVEVSGIESAPPNGLQNCKIISYYSTLKNANGTGVMRQVCFLTTNWIQSEI